MNTKIRIVCPNGSPGTTKIYINDIDVTSNVVSASFRIDAHSHARLLLEVKGNIDIEGLAETIIFTFEQEESD